MLQAYIDDSKSERDPPYFVLGGWLDTAEKWAKFSDAWQEELDRTPKLAYFKLREAYSKRPTGEFYGVGRTECLRRVGQFRRIIERFDPVSFGVGFRVDHYERAFGPLKPGKRANPYYFAVPQVLRLIVEMIGRYDLPREPLNLIFDNQVMEKARVVAAWESAANSVPLSDPTDLFTHILRNSPTWADDRDVLPLQAADMHATWLRLDVENQIEGRERELMPGHTKHLRGDAATFTEQQFLDHAARVGSVVFPSGSAGQLAP